MPQSSVYHAVGRLSVIEKNAIDGAKLERLLMAQNAQDARRILNEYGWPDLGDNEQNASEHVRQACALIRKLSTDDKMVDAFLVVHDIANLKILLKARSLGSEGQMLSPCGTIPLEKMRSAVSERDYSAFPLPLKTPLNTLEKRLSMQVNPMDIDITLDKAHYAWVFSILTDAQKTTKEYFRTKVDIINCAMMLRAMHQEKTAKFAENLLITGGFTSPKQWLRAFTQPEKLPLLMHRHGTRIYAAAIAAFLDNEKLPAFEKNADDHLLTFFMPYRRSISDKERLIGYLLMRERESAAVRLIMAGKENHFPEDALRERLRELYG